MFDYSEDIPKDLRPRDHVFPLGPRMLVRLNELSRVLSQDHLIATSVRARIIKLHSKNPLQERFSHKVTLEIVDSSNKDLIRKQIILSLERVEYHKAISAHDEGRTVQVTGTFNLTGDKLQIEELKNLKFN